MRTHIDLFSGIGGFALAARWNRIKTVQFVEVDKFCQQVLRKNFEGVPIHDDIKTFTNTECKRTPGGEIHKGNINEALFGGEADTHSAGYRSAESPFLLTGGFPCQPFSCAGKRKGTSDDRHLWPHMLRVIKEFSPRWVIAENVGGLTNIKNVLEQSGDDELEDEADNGGEDNLSTSTLVCILNDLEQAGYSVQVFIIPACAVNAPHRRDRVWIIANNNDTGNRTSTIGIDEIGEKENRGILTQPKFSRHDEDVTDTERILLECSRSDNSLQQKTGLSENQRGQSSITAKIPDISEIESTDTGWDENWLEVATRLCGMDDGVSEELYKLETSDRVARLKALGNAIVPQVAFEIMKEIVAMELEGE